MAECFGFGMMAADSQSERRGLPCTGDGSSGRLDSADLGRASGRFGSGLGIAAAGVTSSGEKFIHSLI